MNEEENRRRKSTSKSSRQPVTQFDIYRHSKNVKRKWHIIIEDEFVFVVRKEVPCNDVDYRHARRISHSHALTYETESIFI